jgi:hypothetical protein
MIFSRLLVTGVLTVALLFIISGPHFPGLATQIARADFNFDAVGDWGCNSNTKSTVTNIQGKKPERVLGLGDYSYAPTATCWLNTINPIKSIARINIGNHENDADEGNSQYMNAFGLSKQYYSFNYVNAHVLTMATELSFGKGSAQYNFVDNDLKTAAANPNIKWIIVNYHTPMYTSPNTCSASSCKGSSSLRDVYHALFDKYRVDLVLQGHVHNYQRTYPLKYDPVSPSSPTRTSTSTSSYTDPQGEIFATVGTGGINFHGLSGKSYFVVNQQAQKFGMLDILMANDGSKLTGRYYANGASSPSDQFTISKPTAISSLAISRTNGVDTNLTGNNSQVAEDGESVPSRNRNILKLPDASEIINNTKGAEKTPARVLNNTNNEDSSPDNREITSSESEKSENTVARNILPIANAGKNQIAFEGSEMVLDGSGSKDRDGKIISYQWQQLRGPKVDLDGSSKIKAKFVVPSIEHGEILAFKLTVTDERGGSASAITAVKINADKSQQSILEFSDPLPSSPSVNSGQVRNSSNSSAK